MFTGFIWNKSMFGLWAAIRLLFSGHNHAFSYREGVAYNNMALQYLYYGMASVEMTNARQSMAVHAMRRNEKLMAYFKKTATYKYADCVCQQSASIGRTAVVLAVPHWDDVQVNGGVSNSSPLTFSVWAVHTNNTHVEQETIRPRSEELSSSLLRIFKEPDALPGVIQLMGNTDLSWALHRKEMGWAHQKFDNEAFIEAFQNRKGVIHYLGSVTL